MKSEEFKFKRGDNLNTNCIDFLNSLTLDQLTYFNSYVKQDRKNERLLYKAELDKIIRELE